MTDIKFNSVLIRKPLEFKSNKNTWHDEAFHWRVEINNQSFDFYTGKGLVKENGNPKLPKLDDVLYSLITDSSACEMSFEEWCSNFDYDTDSRKALEIYLLCQDNTAKLRKAGIDINQQRERLKDY